MIRYICFSLLTFFALTIVCKASEDLTVDVIIQGVNQARLTLRSGEVYTIITEEYAAEKSEAEITSWMKTEKARRLEAYKADPLYAYLSTKEYEKNILIPKLHSSAIWYRQRKDIQQTNTAFQVLGIEPDFHSMLYRYKLTTLVSRNPSLDSKRPPISGELSTIVYDSETQVKHVLGSSQYPLSTRVNFAESDTQAGYWRFQLFGRSRFHIPPDAKWIGKETIDGVECHILSFISPTQEKVHIWVDPIKDFCVHKIEYLGTSSSIHIRARRAYKQFEKFGDVWFPKIAEDTVFAEDGTFANRYTIEVRSVALNVDFPKDFFEIDRDFYRPPGQFPGLNFLPNSDRGSTTPTTETEKLLLLCGPQSLSRICERLNVETNLSELKKLSHFHPDRGTTMLGLKNAATFKGLAPTGVKATVTLLKREKVPMPAIAYVNNNHFLVFEGVDKEGVKITDPAQKYNPHLSWDKLTEIWDGDLLIFDKKKARRTQQKQTPLAFTEAPEYDFGKALGGSHIKHTFTIKNIGQKPLQILSVTETCACTASVLSQDEIPPGGRSSISTVLTVPSGNQHVNENLLVLTNDPVQSTITLSLKGEAFIPLKTFPERLAFGNQKPLQTPLTKRVSLHLQDGVELLSIRTDSEHLNTTLQTENDIPYIDVQFLPTLPVGQFSHNLLIDYTYQEEQTTHNVLVFGEVLGELQVVPNRLFFGLIKDASATQKTITISSRNTHPFQITNVVSTTKGINVEKKAGTGETEYQLITTISPKTRPGELTGEIIIHTDSPLQPTVRVPFFGILAGKN